MAKLTVARVKFLTKPGWYGDGGTLYMVIAPGGSKQWVQRLTIHGRRHDLGLGGVSTVTLAEARDQAYENRRAARRGGDPLAAKRRAQMPTFREAADKTYRANLRRWRSPKTGKNWMQGMEKHALPILGDLPVDRIGREEALRVLAPIWSERPEVARKLRQRMRATFQWCIAHGFIESDPAGEAINGALPSMRRTQQHYAAVPHAEVGSALAAVAASGASDATKLGFRFLVLTAARGAEVRNAEWAEVDLESATWTIDGSKMKTGQAHRVPLSREALDVLREAERLRDQSGLIFPSPRGKPLSGNSMGKLLRDLRVPGTAHGMRAAFRSWCADQGVSRELAEASLAHTAGDATEAAYIRSDVIERRRRVMNEWARYIVGESGANVVPLHG